MALRMAQNDTVLILVILGVFTVLMCLSIGLFWMSHSLTPAESKKQVPPAVLIGGIVCLCIVLCTAQIALNISYAKLGSSSSN